MLMEISHYGYYKSADSDAKKENAKFGEVKENTKENSKDKVQEYYKKLCKKFPQIRFNTSGGVLKSSSQKVVVNLSYNCLKKMANDPEFAKQIEWNLSGEATANARVYSCAKGNGVVLGGRTVTYDADGNRQSSCGGMRTANTRNKNSKTDKLHKKYKIKKEHDLKMKKRREERKIIEETIAKNFDVKA